MAERTNRLFRDKMASFFENNQEMYRNWSICIPAIAYHINHLKCASKGGKSRYELYHGIKDRSRFTPHLPTQTGEYYTSEAHAAVITEVIHQKELRIKKLLAKAKEQINDVVYDLGDIVQIIVPPGDVAGKKNFHLSL